MIHFWFSMVFIVLLPLLGNDSLHGQVYLQAGLNASSQRAETMGFYIDSDPKPGYHFGVFGSARVYERLFIQPGALYSSKGLAGRDAISAFNYLELPMHLHYRFSELDGVYIEGGFYFAVLLSAKAEGFDVSDDAKLEDFGGNFGVGYHYGTFSIGLRANIGLINIARVRQTVIGEVSNFNRNAMLYFALKVF